MALVVYGVMRAGDCPAGLRVETRGKMHDVAAVECDGVCALVGVVPGGPMRVRRDAVLAHNEVLHAAMDRGPVLPLRFGMVVADENAVRDDVLLPSAGVLRARLDALEGMAEFQLKAVF